MSEARLTHPVPAEQRRVAALRDLKILDTAPEERFDRITRMLAEELETPMAYVSLVDENRQWLKSSVGNLETEIPREQSFCTRTIAGDGPLVVRDAREDERFADLPFVTGDSQVRFYAGVPIQDPDGHKIGTVCVADSKPRELAPDQLARLERIAARVEAETHAPPTIFVSYAHEDESWKDRLVTHCRVLERQGLLDVWEDRRIGAGEDWRLEIRDAMERAKVAVLLVTAAFLTSDFILEEEVPRLLQRRDAEGLLIVPILVDSCCWDCVDWLAELNLKPADGRPIALGDEPRIESDLTALAGEIGAAVRRLGRIPGPVASARPAPAIETIADRLADPSEAEPEAAVSFEPVSEEAGSQAPTETLGDYTIVSLLSRSDSGSLYHARDTKLAREVTLKQLPPDWRGDPERLDRFEREARILASLRHPNIAVLHSLEESEAGPFLVFDWLGGVTLEQRLEEAPLPVAEALATARDLASALAAAHEQDVVHRNLDPADLMVSPDGRIILFGFGGAKTLPAGEAAPVVSLALTINTMLAATSMFTSPEQLRRQPVDKRSDVFSFAGVLWAMLTGRGPFAGDTVVDALVSIVEREPDWSLLPAAVPESVRTFLRHSLQKPPQGRPADMVEARRELLAALES